VHTSQRLHPVTRATILDTQLFLLPQHVPHREHSNSGNNGKQGVTDRNIYMQQVFPHHGHHIGIIGDRGLKGRGETFSAVMIMPSYQFGLWAWVSDACSRVGGYQCLQGNLVPPCFALKVEVVELSKMLVTTCQTIRCHDPGGQILNFHHCENLRS
jgi:hypothetical protein